MAEDAQPAPDVKRFYLGDLAFETDGTPRHPARYLFCGQVEDHFHGD